MIHTAMNQAIAYEYLKTLDRVRRCRKHHAIAELVVEKNALTVGSLRLTGGWRDGFYIDHSGLFCRWRLN